MIEVINRTDAKHILVPIKSKDGANQVVLIWKHSLSFRPNGRTDVLGAEGSEIRATDVGYGDDLATCSIKYASEVFDYKPGTDLILVGKAYPERLGRDVATDVRLQMGPVNKTIRAFGLRVWQPGTLGGLRAGPPRPIAEPIPLMYELAWGGFDASNPERPVGDPFNTLGRGVSANPKSLIGKAAAQLGYPGQAVGSRGSRPAGFGPIHRHWQPRIQYRGTYDTRWEQARMPLLPEDFDARFHVCVPADQWSSSPLRGDEPLLITGAHQAGPIRLHLPRLQFQCTALKNTHTLPLPHHLDMVTVDMEQERIELVWRARATYRTKLQEISEIRLENSGGA